MIHKLDTKLWSGKTVNTESTLHQISPYIGKIKSSMANNIIKTYSQEGDLILDPFVGSGTIALECFFENRNIICYDLNPYAILLTKAKIFHPISEQAALDLLFKYLSLSEREIDNIDISLIPEWVKSFFHPKTLLETLALRNVLVENNEYFLLGCLLGILHHQRPGFLSYPSSYSVPYLRNNKYPKNEYPEMYEYRELKQRMVCKIQRTYRRIPQNHDKSIITCVQKDALDIDLPDDTIDAIITSPPYMDTLDYYRDNRLRLYFLEMNEYTSHNMKNIQNIVDYKNFMSKCFYTFTKILKPQKAGIIVLGNIRKSKKIDTSSIILELIRNEKKLTLEDIIFDNIRRSYGQKYNEVNEREEAIIVFRKI